MKMKLIEKMVRQEVRRSLKPTGLVGVRGPAKSVPVLVRRAVDARFIVVSAPSGKGGYIIPKSFFEVGGSR